MHAAEHRRRYEEWERHIDAALLGGFTRLGGNTFHALQLKQDVEGGEMARATQLYLQDHLLHYTNPYFGEEAEHWKVGGLPPHSKIHLLELLEASAYEPAL